MKEFLIVEKIDSESDKPLTSIRYLSTLEYWDLFTFLNFRKPLNT